MAQIIAFPGTKPDALGPAAATQQRVRVPRPKPLAVVQSIRGRGRIRKANRPEDEETILVSRMARSVADRAYALAQTKPNSEAHLLALCMAGIADKLPRNNLRVFSTSEDVRAGLWAMSRQVQIANLAWELCDSRRFDAAMREEAEESAYWSAQQAEADAKRWLTYERMIRVPARTLSELKRYKLDEGLKRGMGRLPWMRTYRPLMAAILEEEIERLTVERDARRASRLTKRKEA